MKTTVADFEFFKKRCLHWFEIFQLGQYEPVFTHRPEKGSRDVYPGHATCAVDLESMMALINLATNWDLFERSNKELNRAALHEVLEALLWKIRTMLREYYKEELINHEMHSVIHRIENVVLSANDGKT